ncbi:MULTISPECIES: transketolase [Brachybacterium]|uniref:Transketolase n=2 Tax=Brachybacterium TaxID=43668 RepID=A0A426SMQ4_9MICO|nr:MULTISPECIES: transketolase [Brachybacterium]RRR19562.1 transketolase [Brachybacterium paraconglomeratum]GLI31225.1 transketolase [Brachybacterium conglomeratum]GLK04137.1 transketolase [Brachybacterium conglomeratum]
MTTTMHDGLSLEQVRELAAQLRVDSIRSSTAAGSGHPTSSLSAADLLAVLMSRHLRYDWDDPDTPGNDHLIFSKGHASPLLYSVFRAAGVVSEQELLEGYRRFGQRLEGHPTPVLPWVDVATGSLGQGLPDGVGIALAGAKLEKAPYRVWVLAGDSELAEGSMWEALATASHYGLTNLVTVVDVNRLGQRGETALGWDMDAYAARVEAFGAEAVVVDGHDVEAIDAALARADEDLERPLVILARTVKGKGIPGVEDEEDWHGKPMPEERAEEAIDALGGVRSLQVRGPRPPEVERRSASRGQVELPTFDVGEEIATRKAYGPALAALADVDPRVVALDGEVSNSTGVADFVQAHPERFFEMFIAEQQMVAAATGLAARGYIAYASSFAAFLSRAADFVRMAPVSRADLRLVGSHAGVEIGADGPSQMGLEDLAMMAATQGSTVLYPSDATSTAALVAAMADLHGVSYLRTTRGGYPVLYGPEEEFPVGGSKTLRRSSHDAVTLIGAGVTLHEALGAADALAEEGVQTRVIDAYSVKPIDAEGIRAAVAETGGRAVVAEDHHPEGGLGAAVLAALAAEPLADLHLEHLAVDGVPGSGTTAELLDWAGIDAAHIARAARAVLEG